MSVYYNKTYQSIKPGEVIETYPKFMKNSIRKVLVTEDKRIALEGHIFEWDHFFEVNCILFK